MWMKQNEEYFLYFLESHFQFFLTTCIILGKKKDINHSVHSDVKEKLNQKIIL